MENQDRTAGFVSGGTSPSPSPKQASSKPRKVTATFSMDGTVQHTLRDEFVRLFPKEPRVVSRMTLIEHDVRSQRFYVVFLRGFHPKIGSLRGDVLTKTMYDAAESGFDAVRALWDEHGRSISVPYDMLTYETYAEAVNAELHVVDKLRQIGFTFTVPGE